MLMRCPFFHFLNSSSSLNPNFICWSMIHALLFYVYVIFFNCHLTQVFLYFIYFYFASLNNEINEASYGMFTLYSENIKEKILKIVKCLQSVKT